MVGFVKDTFLIILIKYHKKHDYFQTFPSNYSIIIFLTAKEKYNMLSF